MKEQHLHNSYMQYKVNNIVQNCTVLIKLPESINKFIIHLSTLCQKPISAINFDNHIIVNIAFIFTYLNILSRFVSFDKLFLLSLK